MPRNVSYLINDEFNYSGWVELYNSGAEQFDLSQCVFSDEKHTWESEATGLLAPGGYALFYFDELNSYNHASFKLDADGGVLTLSTKEGLELDRVSYEKAFRNISFGRVADGGATFATLGSPSPGGSNNSSTVVTEQALSPIFALAPGFYKGAQTLAISAPATNAKIYYTTDGSEPVAGKSPLYEQPIAISSTSPIRAVAVEEGKLASDITTGTYFIDNRDIKLPVISITAEDKHLYDDSIGILVVGVNGGEVPGYCSFAEDHANFMTDWERPCNIEYFDRENKLERLNMEVRTSNFGACSRTKHVKSLKIKANKVYGGKKMDCALFREKPSLQWKSIVLRNSGNDFGRSYLRDGFMQSLLVGQLDIDHQAFEPSVVFINGKYYGLLNIRERTNKDFIFSNYGLDEDEIYIEEVSSSLNVGTEGYKDVVALLEEPDANADGMYEKIDQQIDVNEFLNYFMAQIYYANTDWAGGNVKAWKRRQNGRWRWILYDTDFGFSCYGSNFTTNTFSNAEKNVTFKGFIKNEKVKDRLIAKFTVHLGSTFRPERVNHILDSMTSYIAEEAYIYHDSLGKKVESDWDKSVQLMVEFANKRPDNLYKHIATYFKLGDTASLRLHADLPEARFLFNDEPVPCSDMKSKYYVGSEFRVKPIAPDGYKFKHWEIVNERKLINASDAWRYYDRGNLPAEGWMNAGYDDSAWRSDVGPLGFGIPSLVKTAINNKDEAGANLMTAYFRKTFTIDDGYSNTPLEGSIQYNNGAVIYLNGKELLRVGMPDGPVAYDTKASSYVSRYKTETFRIEPDLLQMGVNTIAVELHGNSETNNSLGFGLTLEDPLAKPKPLVETAETLTGVFGGASVCKAVFEEDPSWDPSAQRIFLNEICATNRQYVDECFEDEDWIEVYNDGTSPVNIGGMFISDERKNLEKYRIADTVPELTTIPAKGYLVLWADAQPEQGVLHTNFELPITRPQTVTLSKRENGELFVIDSVRYELHVKGETYARAAHAYDGKWAITSLPTFKAENKMVGRVEVDEVVSDGISAVAYPNPTTDVLWFSLPWETQTEVAIGNGIQTLLRSTIVNRGGVEVEHLPAGVYFAIVRNLETQDVQVLKFIKY